MDNQKNRLLIDENPSGDLLLNSNSEPVWSVKNALELEALENIAEVFGSTIERVTGETTAYQHGEEEVLGLGDDIGEAGLLYAHLTNRKYTFAKSLKEIDTDNLPSVIITKPDLLNSELLHLLYNPRKNNTVAPGIICSENPQFLRKQVLVRAAASHLSGSLESVRVDVFPGRDFGYKKMRAYEILGGKASAVEMRAALGRGTGLLTLKTHADGIDAQLLEDLTLCPMSNLQNNPNKLKRPVCQETQVCHRHGISMEEMLQSGKLLAPEEIVARIFIFNSCFGLLLPSSIIDVGWSLGQRFLMSDKVGAMITTWGLTFTSGDRMEELTRNLLSGMSVGQALARYNQSDEAKKFGGHHRMCLLGDPRVKLPLNEQNPIRINQQGLLKNREPSKPVQLNIETSKVEFFEACFTNLLNTTTDEQKYRESRLILSKIDDYKNLFLHKTALKNSKDSIGLDLRTAIVEFALNHAQIFRTWLELASDFSMETATEPCSVCGQPLIYRNIGIRLSEKFERRIKECINCGVLEDSPIGVNLKFSVGENAIRLDGKFPQKKCTVGVLMAASKIETVKWICPSNEDGTPLLNFKLPEVDFKSSIRIHVMIIWDNNYVIINKLLRSIKDISK